MSDGESGLQVVDGLKLSPARQEALRPGEEVTDWAGLVHRLPRFFYRIESWEQAKAQKLTEHFTLAELVKVDCREADILLREVPHYVPCAVVILARYLEAFRVKVGQPVHISANGGYRSPAHRLSTTFSPHNWGTAADIYRVGSEFLDNKAAIEKYAGILQGLAPEVHISPYGSGRGETDDHLHVDIGYVTFVPRGCNEAQGR